MSGLCRVKRWMMGVLVGVVLVGCRAKEAGPGVWAPFNGNQFIVCLFQYAGDHDDLTPESVQELMAFTQREYGDAGVRIFYCDAEQKHAWVYFGQKRIMRGEASGQAELLFRTPHPTRGRYLCYYTDGSSQWLAKPVMTKEVD